MANHNAPESEEATVAKLLSAGRIAVVGLSDDPSRDSYRVAAYLMSVGKQIVPVNPNVATVLGMKAYPSLADVPGEIDLVNVFRRPEACAEIVREALARGTAGVWLQLGIASREARRLCADAGVPYVEDRCILIEHHRVTSGG